MKQLTFEGFEASKNLTRNLFQMYLERGRRREEEANPSNRGLVKLREGCMCLKVDRTTKGSER